MHDGCLAFVLFSAIAILSLAGCSYQPAHIRTEPAIVIDDGWYGHDRGWRRNYRYYDKGHDHWDYDRDRWDRD